MQGTFSKIGAEGGGAFDCYLVTPVSEKPVAAVVLASAIHGLDADMLAIADEFAACGFIAAVPICSGVRSPARCRGATRARRSVRSRAVSGSRPAKTT